MDSYAPDIPPLPGPDEPAPPDGVLVHLGIDGCVRLRLRIDAAVLAAELARLPDAAWQSADRDPVVHAHVDSFFVIGHARGPLPLPPEDRTPLAALPRLRELLRTTVPATPVRGIVQRLHGGGLIPIHTDTRRYFDRTVRLSFHIASDGPQRLYCNGAWYTAAPGEVWAIDNLHPHGVPNRGAAARINVVADYEPSPALIALLLAGETGLGQRDDDASRTLQAQTQSHYRRRRWQSLRYELGKLWRRRVLGIVAGSAQSAR